MSELFTSFPKTSKADWISLLEKELKGASPDTLQKFNRIEEIIIPSYVHGTDASPAFSDPGLAPFTRGAHAGTNDWFIGSCFYITDEKTTNAGMLDTLMKGTTALVLHATNDRAIDFDILLNEVGLEFIHTTFYARTEIQANSFLEKMGSHHALVITENTPSWIAAGAKSHPTVRPFGVNAYSVHEAGATTWQEIAIALTEGHELLVQQLEIGLSADEAAGNIHFVLGTGNKYFYEIAKMRAFRTAWSRIVEEYGPSKAESSAAYMTAQTGFVNISVKDPYTNLLRQTTEAMSAVIGGVDQLVVQPYDLHTATPNPGFTQRMATNISLLLKEESYLDKVIDPAGGSYALDNLTTAVLERAWALFQEIERKGGISEDSVRSELSESIREKAQQRLQLVRDKKETLIGINVFPNPETLQNRWKPLPAAWNNLPSLNIESELENA